jgi:hypothetical protein
MSTIRPEYLHLSLHAPFTSDDVRFREEPDEEEDEEEPDKQDDDNEEGDDDGGEDSGYSVSCSRRVKDEPGRFC